jgi:hypothetical protein
MNPIITTLKFIPKFIHWSLIVFSCSYFQFSLYHSGNISADGFSLTLPRFNAHIFSSHNKNVRHSNNFLSSCSFHSNHRKLYFTPYARDIETGEDVQVKPEKTPKEVNQSDEEIKKELSLNLSQFKPFWNIAMPFFKEDETARSSLIAVVALTLLNSGVSVAFSYISRDFYNALNIRDEALFYEKITLFFGALVVAIPVTVYYRFLREKLSLYWREGLTSRVLKNYYSNRTFYVMETIGEIDNPDQRITEDIRHFTKTSLDFLITLFTSLIDLFSFSAILFQIYPGLFFAIIAYAGTQ